MDIDVDTWRRCPVMAMIVIGRMAMMFVIILMFDTACGSEAGDDQEH